MSDVVRQVAAELLVKALGITLGLLAVMLYAQMRELVKHKIGSEKYGRLEAEVNRLVRWAEMVGRQLGWDGAHKKQVVTAAAMQIVHFLKIDWLSADMIDSLIESLVFTMNQESGKYAGRFPTEPPHPLAPAPEAV